MSRAIIAEVLKEAAGVPMTTARKATDAILDTIHQELKRAQRFNLPNFGTFILAERAARTGRNPQTGERIQIKATTTVRFKPSPGLRDSLLNVRSAAKRGRPRGKAAKPRMPVTRGRRGAKAA